MLFAPCLWKPTNDTGVVFLVDFGFAKRVLWRLCKVPLLKGWRLVERNNVVRCVMFVSVCGVLFVSVCVCVVFVYLGYIFG